MGRNKLGIISAIVIVTSILSLTLGGCSKTNKLDTTLIISDDVKGEEKTDSLQIVSKDEYVVKDTGVPGNSLFYNEDNSLYVTAEIRGDGLYTFLKENIILENGEAIKVEEPEFEKVFDKLYEGHSIYKMSENKAIFYNYYADTEIIIDTEKFLQSESYKAINFESHNYQYSNGKILIFIRDEETYVDKVLWYDIENHSEGTINMPENTRITYVPWIDEEYMYYVGSKKDIFYNSVGRIDLKNNDLVDTVDVGEFYRVYIIDKDKLLVCGEVEQKTMLKLVNMKNKVVRDITALETAYHGDGIIPKSKDRIIYEEILEDKKRVMVAYLNNDEIEGKCFIYECGAEEYVSIAVSNDGKSIAIGSRDYDSSGYNTYINLITEIKLNK